MSNYTKEDTCVGCGAHISECHYVPCVYDPDFKPTYWGDLAELTHAKQVEQFNFCTCEEQEYFPYLDCPRPEVYCGDHLISISQCNCKP